MPIRTSCWPTSVESPARSCAMPQQRVSSSRSRPRSATALLPRGERPQQREPAEHHERHRREAQRRDLRAVDRRRRARLHEAPHAAAQDREHDQAQAGRRERHAHDVELRAPLGCRRPRDLSCARAGCRSRPRSRPRTRTATRTRSSPSRRSAGRRRSRPRRSRRAARTPAPAHGPHSVAAVSAAIAGTTSTAPNPSTPDQPTSSTARFGLSAVVSDPMPVDRQPDRERPVGAQDVAELRARAA